MTDSVGETKTIKEFKLKEDNELRFEVGHEDVILELLEGNAEIFGTELELHKKYTFLPGTRIAVFTWKNAVVELVGPTTSAYVSEETPMVIYLNTHAALEQLRQHVEKEGDPNPRGPRIMIVGPTDVGKSTVSRILCNYAVRQGRSPIYVDLDVGQNSISVPGSISAIYINKTADVIEGFDKSKPIVFNFSAVSPSDNLPLYDLLVEQLANVVDEKCSNSVEAGLGGVVINTCGWINGEGFQCLVNAATAFTVDVVVVLDHERLFNDLQKTMPEFLKVLHLPKSGGVENRSRDMRLKSRSSSIQRYFYGSVSDPLYPFTFEVTFDEVQIVQIGTEKVPDSCLPVGMKQEDHHTKVVPVNITPALNHYLLAVTPEKEIGQAIVKTPVCGFVVITNVDMNDKLLSILCPQSNLPNKIFVLTKIQFLDDHNIRM